MEFFFNNQYLFGEEIINGLHLFIGSWFDYFMIAITEMGSETFFMVLFPLLYWCHDRTLAIRVSVVFFISVTFSDNLKEFINHPRPDPGLLHEHIAGLSSKYTHEISPGFPSSHTMSTVAVWSSLIYYLRNRYIIIPGALFILLIPYSRIYLGVHYPGDLLGSYILGIILLLLLIPLIKIIEKNYDVLKKYLFPVLVLAVGPVLAALLPGKLTLKLISICSGFYSGVIICDNFFSFEAKNNIRAALIKLFTGIMGVFIIRIGLKVILPDHPALTYVRYWFIGFWVSFLAPYIFSRFAMLKGSLPAIFDEKH